MPFDVPTLFDLLDATPAAIGGGDKRAPRAWSPPTGAVAASDAGLAAVRVLRRLADNGRSAADADRDVLAGFPGWGPLAFVFDTRAPRWGQARSELAALLGVDGYAAARRAALNAFYTPDALIDAMWQLAVDLGFSGGAVLDPGCGTARFAQRAPAGLAVEYVGVDLDPTSAALAGHLATGATIRTEDFAETPPRQGGYLLAVGNVPFGDIPVHDPIHNRGRHHLHNYTLVKALHLLTPTHGLLVALTSRWTLDATRTAARDEIAELADLVAAVRLPAGALPGTDAIADLVVLRRRPAGQAPGGQRFEQLIAHPADPALRYNRYFADHPDHVLGDLTVASGPYGPAITVTAPTSDDPSAQFRALCGTVAAATAAAPPAPSIDTDYSGTLNLRAGHARTVGHIEPTGNGFVVTSPGGATRPHRCPGSQARELRALCGLRDAAVAVLDSQHNPARWAAAARRLGQLYDSYQARYGTLNRYRWQHHGPHTPDPDHAVDSGDRERARHKRHPAMGGFRSDPDAALVFALEVFDDDTQTATKAPIFERVVCGHPRVPAPTDDPAEALALTLDATGRVDLDRIAGLLGTDHDRAINALGERIYRDPTVGAWSPAELYLSGDITPKLDAARSAAEADPAMARNVAALEAVSPPPLRPDEIDAGPGAPWLPVTVIEAFCADVLGVPHPEGKVIHETATATWELAIPSYERSALACVREWGTEDADGVALLEAACNQRRYEVHRSGPDGFRYLDRDATLTAQETQERLSDRFRDFVWEDPERAETLAARYNRLFNSRVPTRYKGGHLTLPGLAVGFTPHPHQLDAVWRIVCTRQAGIHSPTGSGKTLVQIAAAMELKRLGKVTCSLLVVSNHMLAQVTRDFLQFYPTARVLVADKDAMSAAGRAMFAAKAATGEWDAIVTTWGAFGRLPVSREDQAGYLHDKIARYRAALERLSAGAARCRTAKGIEGVTAKLEARVKELLHKPTDRLGAITFPQALGCQQIFCDEAQAVKNLQFPTRIREVARKPCKRAEDLALKLYALRRWTGRDEVAVFATATPVMNALHELYVMQLLLQRPALDRLDIGDFDAWAATFASRVSSLELAPDASTYQVRTRLARYRNVPELLDLWSDIAEVHTSDDLNLPEPAITGGAPEIVVVPGSPDIHGYIVSLAERAKAVKDRKVPPKQDNMLAICTDGRKAALDPRLAGLNAPDPEHSKVAAAAERIAGIYHANKTRRYLWPDGTEHPTPGAFQIVFCDLGTPGGAGHCVYDDLRAMLVDAAVPAEGIAYMHQARSDSDKDALFARCREGRIAVLITSIERAGVGTNVQHRAIAGHLLVPPWRPADVTQSLYGRVVRQGNQNPEVSLHIYVTQGSFDAFVFAALQRKAAFISAVLRRQVTVREIDDVGADVLTFAQVKALATGNPLIVEHAEVEAEIAKLARRSSQHTSKQRLLRGDIANGEHRLVSTMTRLDGLSALASTRNRTGYRDAAGTPSDNRDAGAAIAAQVAAATDGGIILLGTLDGLALWAQPHQGWDRETVHFGIGSPALRVEGSTSHDKFLGGNNPARLARFRRLADDLPNRLARCRQGIDELRRQIDDAQALLTVPFDDQTHLDELCARRDDLQAALETGPAPSQAA